MLTSTFPLTSCDRELDLSPSSFGELRRSELSGDFQSGLAEDGYLFLPGLLNREDVLAARKTVTDRLAVAGMLDPRYPSMDAVAAKNCTVKFMPKLAENNTELHRVLYEGPMMAFFEKLIGGKVRHFDFTWFRAVSPGRGTNPHCDLVYMNRGTHRLYTAWTPIGDISLEQGGLIILENSHRQSHRIRRYLERDVDTYCVNSRDAEDYANGKKRWSFDGALSKDPVSLREKLGGRWLTAEFRAGDVLVFGMPTVHASLDNHSDRIRLSSDSRYQSADEPADERWVGEKPIGHSLAGQRGRVC